MGLLIALASIPALLRRDKLLRLPTSTNAASQGNAVVKIRGTVVALDREPVTAPFSSRRAVWARSSVFGVQGNGPRKAVAEDLRGGEFGLDDGSGETARVVPTGALMFVEATEVGTYEPFNKLPPELESFIKERRLRVTSWFGARQRLRFVERVLCPGDTITVVGTAHRLAGPPVSEGYRSAPATQLLVSSDRPEDPLIVATSEADIASTLASGGRLSVTLLALGAVMMFAEVMWNGH
jgi:hypothetical protein